MTRALACVTLLLLACSAHDRVRVQTSGARPQGVTLTKVAVAPFGVHPQAREGEVETEGPALIRSRVVEAVSEGTEWQVVPPEEIERWLALPDVEVDAADPGAVAAEVAKSFGADGILYGSVRRYRARVGGARGATRPAAVWFTLELLLPGGQRPWQGTFHEQQQAMSDDLLSLPQAMGRGFRWVEASQLAGEGSAQLIDRLVHESASWR